MECQQIKNLKNCPCTYTACQKRGKCCECVAYHRKRGELPGCYFTKKGEATYDRSIERFISEQTK